MGPICIILYFTDTPSIPRVVQVQNIQVITQLLNPNYCFSIFKQYRNGFFFNKLFINYMYYTGLNYE